MGAVVDQVRALVARGHAEIVLTGVDLTSYGADLPGAPKLGTLTRQILRHVPELKRRNPAGRIVMYSLHDEPAYQRVALREGADGYVVKDDPNGLLEAVSA